MPLDEFRPANRLGRLNSTRSPSPVLPDLAVGGNPHDDWYVAPGYANHGAGISAHAAGGRLTHRTCIPRPSMARPVGLANGGIGLILDNRSDLDVGMNCGKARSGWRMGFWSAGYAPWRICPSLLVAHAGDWHATADVYREQVAVRDKVLALPDWFRY